MPRTLFEMSDEQLTELLDAGKPVPYMVLGGRWAASPQENANRAWERLGAKMGFDPLTVQPAEGKEQQFFWAEPSEPKPKQPDDLPF